MRWFSLGLILVALVSACSSSESQECIPDSLFCEQDTLRKCTTDGTDSVLVKVCETSCNAGQCVGFMPQDVTADEQSFADVPGEEDAVQPEEVEAAQDVQDLADEPDSVDVETPPDTTPDAGCEDECDPEAFFCVGIKEIHYCVEGPDGCRVWDEGQSCNDGNDCTDDACAAEKGCVTADNKEPCDDGNECTGPDQCSGGECVPGPSTCDCVVDADCEASEDGDLCNGTLMCVDTVCVLDPETVVQCAGPVGPCLENVCEPATGQCVDKWVQDGKVCDDSNACTSGDACYDGQCSGTDPVACDDSNPCTYDDCEPQPGCQHTPMPDGTDCGGNKECQGGICVDMASPETLASNLDSPHDLVLSGGIIYFVEDDNDEGTVKKVSATGGNVDTLASNLNEPLAITADDSFVYWTERNGGKNGRLRKVSKNGGAVIDLATDLRNAQNHLAVYNGYLYFGDGKEGGGGVIKKVGVNGGTTILVEGNGLLNLNTAIDVKNDLVYFTNDYEKVLRVPVNGGSVTELGSGEPSGLAVDGSWIYWTEYSNGAVRRMPVNGGPAITVATNTYGAADLVVDGNYVYWIENNNPGDVMRASITGGDEKKYSSQANSVGLAVDGQYVYYAVSVYINKGKIMRVAK